MWGDVRGAGWGSLVGELFGGLCRGDVGGAAWVGELCEVADLCGEGCVRGDVGKLCALGNCVGGAVGGAVG